MCRNCRLLQYFSPFISDNFCKMAPSFNNNMYLYLCGTKAHNPRNQVVYANLTNLGRHQYVPGIGYGIAKCLFDPEDSSTAVWVESRNPRELPALYSNTNAEFTMADKVIFQTDLFDLGSGRRE